ncbi:MAG TPA: rhamnulokinase [Terracidiphilus sp.]|nr:rhamnulokinase [Terracidiphilus sp.]
MSTVRSAAVDLGAGSGRLIVGALADGRIAIEEMGRFRTPTCADEAGKYQCWDLDAIVARTWEILEQAAAAAPLESVGVDGWGVDYVLLGADRQRVGQAICYRDKRTTGVMERMCAQLGREEIYRRTGIQFLPFNTLYQLAACAEQEPGWLERAQHLLMIPDYLHYCFCGALANEYTNASTTQMLGLDGAWDPVLMEAAGVARGLMQPPLDAGTALGAMQLGGRQVKVIAPATHDTGSAVAGTPLAGADEAYISSGTWSLMGIESRMPIATADACARNFTNEGGLERRFRVLKNITGMWPMQRVCEEHGVEGFHAAAAEVEAAEAWRSIVDPNDPAFLNPASMTEAIRSYCRRTGQPVPETAPQLMRIIVDSLALSYRKVKEELELLTGRRLSRIRILGGGCRNRLLNQLCADVCQLPVSAGPVEASALGNLCAQWIALGAIENLDAARGLIRASFPGEEYSPKAAVPDAVWERFVKLLYGERN